MSAVEALRQRGVLLALAPAPYGGLETVVEGLALGLRDAGIPVTAALAVEPGSPVPLGETLQRGGVDVVRIEGPARAYRQEWRSLHAVLAARQPAVLHSHGYRTDLLIGLSGLARAATWVATAHGFTRSSLRTRLYETAQRLVWRRAHGVVAVSVPLAHQLTRGGLSGRRVTVLPNVLRPAATRSREEARRLLGLPVEARVLGWVGRLSTEKDPGLALQAVAALHAPRPTLVMIGDGPLRGELERLVGELDVGECTRLLGAVAGAGSLMAAFDGLLLTSRTEGTPMVLLEARRAGVPVIATAVGGVPAALEGADARLVRPGDAPALAEAIHEWSISAGGPTKAAAPAEAYEAWIAAHLRCYRDAVECRAAD